MLSKGFKKTEIRLLTNRQLRENMAIFAQKPIESKQKKAGSRLKVPAFQLIGLRATDSRKHKITQLFF